MGRIERLFKTLQDRLIKELRLKKINTIEEEGNKYLEEHIDEHNSLFAIQADDKENMHRMVKEKDYMENLKDFIIKKDLSDKVRFTGYLNGLQLHAEYRKADVFVLPTLNEGFGAVVSEAMSFGLPVVVSKNGGILEQVTDGKEGFLVPPRDPKYLANKLIILLTDPQLRRRMGNLGILSQL